MENSMCKEGVVFDIQRFSIYDGPGIRTTVFLKGCSMNCLWCHNPEAISKASKLSYNNENCTNCFKCVTACPNKVHFIKDNKHEVNFSLCKLCGKCVEGCIYSALRIIGYNTDASTVIKEVIKDIKYYTESGGGLTLSGGEPMLQIDFTTELLKLARMNLINTCIETAGFSSRQNFENILPLVDIWLFDYKATGEEAHKRLTGVSNNIILENFKYLYDNGASIILRCPIIPKINDSKEHFRAIADIENKYPRLKSIEILPYHNMGVSKARNIGDMPQLEDMQTVNMEVKTMWQQLFNDLGCKKVIII
jgi:glycyl-radical enzyme activating protein